MPCTKCCRITRAEGEKSLPENILSVKVQSGIGLTADQRLSAYPQQMNNRMHCCDDGSHSALLLISVACMILRYIRVMLYTDTDVRYSRGSRKSWLARS